MVAKDPSFLHADMEDTDQTGRIPRSLGACHFVGFVMHSQIPRNIYVSLPIESMAIDTFIIGFVFLSF